MQNQNSDNTGEGVQSGESHPASETQQQQQQLQHDQQQQYLQQLQYLQNHLQQLQHLQLQHLQHLQYLQHQQHQQQQQDQQDQQQLPHHQQQQHLQHLQHFQQHLQHLQHLQHQEDQQQDQQQLQNHQQQQHLQQLQHLQDLQQHLQHLQHLQHQQHQQHNPHEPHLIWVDENGNPLPLEVLQAMQLPGFLGPQDGPVTQTQRRMWSREEVMNPENHKQCKEVFEEAHHEGQLHQSTASVAEGGTDIPPSEQPRPPRTPAPDAVVRATHEPFFATDDRSLTSLFRLPYDIRLPIYRELLALGEGETVRWFICQATRRLVRMGGCARNPDDLSFTPLGLFPAILETCRAINEEASPILYGENRFALNEYCHAAAISKSWRLYDRPLGMITNVGLGTFSVPAMGFSMAERLSLFPNLRWALFETCPEKGDVEKLLEEAGPQLFAIEDLRINMFWEEGTGVYNEAMAYAEQHGERSEEDFLAETFLVPLLEYNAKHNFNRPLAVYFADDLDFSVYQFEESTLHMVVRWSTLDPFDYEREIS